MSAKAPIHQIELPAHHPAINDMDEDDTIMVHAKKAPAPKPMTMPGGMKTEERNDPRPMPLTHTFHVTHIERMKKKAGGLVKRPGGGDKGGAMEYMKSQQTNEAYSGLRKPTNGGDNQ